MPVFNTRDSINDNASAKLVEKYETGRSQILHGHRAKGNVKTCLCKFINRIILYKVIPDEVMPPVEIAGL